MLQLEREKGKEGENDIDMIDNQESSALKNFLSTLDIFAGCGGVSEGLQKVGASVTKSAIEYEEPAGDAFKLNHPDTLAFVHNCNVILRAIMTTCGDIDDCISTSEADELTLKPLLRRSNLFEHLIQKSRQMYGRKVKLEIPALINVDFVDVRAIMENAGSSLMIIGTGMGK